MKSAEQLSLAIVGNSGGTNVGESLRRAALDVAANVIFFDAYQAAHTNRLIRSVAWRLGDRRPWRLNRFSEEVVAACSQGVGVLIATGASPLTGPAVRALRARGAYCINYSTDDPWNPSLRSRWLLTALPEYNTVFTTRTSNVEDLRTLGCPDVIHLPFGYDDGLFFPATASPPSAGHDILFVGGADPDRVEFMQAFMRNGLAPALVGGYWDTYPTTKSGALGHKSPEELRQLTANAKINLCLVRRANRDGHVMRSLEIAAIGGCMLAEDTPEHRELFGSEGEAVVYFSSPQQAAAKASKLLADPHERTRLALTLRDRIQNGRHTYRDRLKTMLAAAPYAQNTRPFAAEPTPA